MATDEELLTAYYGCNNASFEDLYARHQDRFLRYYRSRQAPDVDEMLQRLWVKVVATKGSPREFEAVEPEETELTPEEQADLEREVPKQRFDPTRGNVVPWLYGIAARDLTDRHRSFQRKEQKHVPVGTDEGERDVVNPESLEEEVVLSELQRVVLACRNELPSPYSDILRLMEDDELTLAAVGAVFGRDVNWAFRERRRAHEKLRAALQQRGIDQATLK